MNAVNFLKQTLKLLTQVMLSIVKVSHPLTNQFLIQYLFF